MALALRQLNSIHKNRGDKVCFFWFVCFKQFIPPSNNLYLPNLSKINIHIALVLLLLNLSKDKYSYSTSLAIVKFEQVNTGWVISSRTHCPTFSPPQISDIPQAGFEPAHIHVFIYKQLIFSTQPQCCLSFSWIELQMLLRCCLIHNKTIIILRHVLHLVYLGPRLSLILFMSYLRDLFFYVHSHFIIINHITSLKQTHLFFVHF